MYLSSLRQSPSDEGAGPVRRKPHSRTTWRMPCGDEINLTAKCCPRKAREISCPGLVYFIPRRRLATGAPTCSAHLAIQLTSGNTSPSPASFPDPPEVYTEQQHIRSVIRNPRALREPGKPGEGVRGRIYRVTNNVNIPEQVSPMF